MDKDKIIKELKERIGELELENSELNDRLWKIKSEHNISEF